MFYAYADPMAGEIGTVYQACNWLYLGVGVGRSDKGRWRFFNRREGKWRGERSVRKRRLVLAELRAHPEWIAEWMPDKGRYVWFEGTQREKRDLVLKLKYPPQPYPKRWRPAERQGHQQDRRAAFRQCPENAGAAAHANPNTARRDQARRDRARRQCRSDDSHSPE